MNSIKWDIAKDSKVKINSKWYIDFTSSIFSQNFGHNNSYVVREVRKQLKKCSHAYGYNTDIKEKYLEALKAKIGYKNILLFSTGAEAIEASIKIVLNNGYICVGKKGSMHGRTLGAEALVGKRKLAYIETVEAINKIDINSKMKAFFIEGYQGYDCRLLTEEEINHLKDLQKNNIVIFDEIQSGFFRTDGFFISNYYKFQPDILVIGKSMGGGFPLSAVCFNTPFSLKGLELTSTHSGQPLQMAAGYGVLKYISKEFSWRNYLQNIKIMRRFFNGLNRNNNYVGMVGAIQTNYYEDDVYNYCFNNKILVTKTGKGWIKIAPPVNIDSYLLSSSLEIVDEYVN